MAASNTPEPPAYLTTKEVAELLRVKERKVYDLAAAGEIPHRRITGKLLFPSEEIAAWIDSNGAEVTKERPPVLAGSHDPLLEWAARESQSGLALLVNGSFDGLDRFESGEAALCGIHIADQTGWNIQALSGRSLGRSVLVHWAHRKRGLILSEDLRGKVKSLADLAGKRIVLRQASAGTSKLFESLLQEAGMNEQDLVLLPDRAGTESEAAIVVASGRADAALGIEAVSQQLRLPFVPLLEESFDLLIDQHCYFSEPLQKLLSFTRSDTFRKKADMMGGYNLAAAGDVRWVSPWSRVE